MFPVIIGVMGAISSGKTTLVSELRKALPYKTTVYCEVAQALLDEMNVMAEELYHTPEIVDFERDVLAKMLSVEEEAAKANAEVVLLDRVIYDWLYFATRYAAQFAHVKQDEFREMMDIYTEAAARRRYDGIIFCRPVDDPLADKVEQMVQDRVIEGIVATVRGVPKIYVSGTVEERVRQAVDFVEAVVRRAKCLRFR